MDPNEIDRIVLLFSLAFSLGVTLLARWNVRHPRAPQLAH
jgi:hypothetical protein